MEKQKLSITCPLCGRKNKFPLGELKQGFALVCPFCKVKLNLHGHMWEEVQAEIEKLKKRTEDC